MLWRKDVDVWIQTYSPRHMDALVKVDNDTERWRITGIYGHPEVNNRKDTWKLVRYLSQKSIRPWVCVGDFNEILHQHEKVGMVPCASWQIADFRCFLDECGYRIWDFLAILILGAMVERHRTLPENDWIVRYAALNGLSYFQKCKSTMTFNLVQTTLQYG
ncbi:UNVERIFIED_CONTAM: hypothetical protein Slati_0187700 [Sesamum latifolium]|uniref:Uncharacterized protein n=1 Tax=Sesamum latifolium TaxID=2727402 RepID=A0AAW2YAS4_9LAMI